MPSVHSTGGATARGGYNGAIDATGGRLEEYGRGAEEEDAYHYRHHSNRHNEGASGERYLSPPKRQSSGDLYNGHHDERYHSTYHQSARPVSHHHYDDPRRHSHQHVNHPDSVESRYDNGHGATQGAWSNQQPDRQFNYQPSHGIMYSKAAPPSNYHAADLQDYYHHPPLSQFHPNFSDMHSNDNSVPTLAESDTSDDYYDNSERYVKNEDSFWDRKLAPGEKVAKHPPPLREKVAGVKMVEVSPGVHLRLRGADETWRAIQVDFYMPCECVCCTSTIFAIQDADFVLCPVCRVVSPMDGKVFDGASDGGVGLGFQMEELAKWQEEIERERRAPHHRPYH